MRAFFRSPVWKVGRLLLTPIAVYMAYTGATGRELVWETGPGVVGDVSHVVADATNSNVGRWVLVGMAVAVLLVAWVPTAAANVGIRTPSPAAIRRGPRFASGRFMEYTRNAIGGPDLQVIGVEIYNERESGGERNTARAVVPSLEAFDLGGNPVAQSSPGVWFPDKRGQIPDAVDFRPTHEKHPVELAGKFPGGVNAWLAGEADPPSLHPGIYEIRATLRGDNLRRPAVMSWYLRNPGAGGRLSASNDPATLAPVDWRPLEREQPPPPPNDPQIEPPGPLSTGRETRRMGPSALEIMAESARGAAAVSDEFARVMAAPQGITAPRLMRRGESIAREVGRALRNRNFQASQANELRGRVQRWNDDLIWWVDHESGLPTSGRGRFRVFPTPTTAVAALQPLPLTAIGQLVDHNLNVLRELAGTDATS